jgi:HSP20 family molecular chaperone IbpA
MEVTGASIEDGMLNIRVDRIIPEEKKPKTIKIK